MNPLLRAALPSVPVVGLLPGIRKASPEGFTGLERDGGSVTVDRTAVDAYAAVCGFPVKDTVPLTYPHLLGFASTMSILSDAAFPAPAIGTVHLEQSIRSHRPITIGETLAVAVDVGAPTPHPKGTTYEFTTLVRAGDELVWEGVSSYLRRGRGDESAPAGPSFPDVKESGTQWSLGADLGRRYAAVSGDHNPIHLYALTAKALGFPRQIAHGMWSLARCVAALENRLPDAARVDVAFKKPILLPGKVAFGAAPEKDGYAFALKDPRTGAPHLAGATSTL